MSDPESYDFRYYEAVPEVFSGRLRLGMRFGISGESSLFIIQVKRHIAACFDIFRHQEVTIIVNQMCDHWDATVVLALLRIRLAYRKSNPRADSHGFNNNFGEFRLEASILLSRLAMHFWIKVNR